LAACRHLRQRELQEDVLKVAGHGGGREIVGARVLPNPPEHLKESFSHYL
jgi:hypothetical protein